MQARVLVVCKVGAAHSLVALTSYLVAVAAAVVWLLPLLLLLLLLLLCHCYWVSCIFLKVLARPDQTPIQKELTKSAKERECPPCGSCDSL